MILILGLVYYSYNPENSFLFPKCPLKYFTGLSCPGCGSQRAIHEILHLNFRKAFEYNSLLMVSIPYLLIGVAFNFENIKIKYPKMRTFLFGQKTILFILAIVIGFFIFRNL